MSKDSEKKINDAVRELSIDDLESVAGGRAIEIPDAIISPVKPAAEIQREPIGTGDPKRPGK